MKAASEFKKGDVVIAKYYGKSYVGYILDMEYWAAHDRKRGIKVSDPEYLVSFPGKSTYFKESKIRHLTSILK